MIYSSERILLNVELWREHPSSLCTDTIYAPDAETHRRITQWLDDPYEPEYLYSMSTVLNHEGHMEVKTSVVLGRENPLIVSRFVDRMKSFIEHEVNIIRYGY